MNALDQLEKLLGISWRKWRTEKYPGGAVCAVRFTEHQHPSYTLLVIAAPGGKWEWIVSLNNGESKSGNVMSISNGQEICERLIDEMYPNHVGKLGKE